MRRIYAEYDRDLKKIEKEIADMPAAVTRKIDVRGSAWLFLDLFQCGRFGEYLHLADGDFVEAFESFSL